MYQEKSKKDNKSLNNAHIWKAMLRSNHGTTVSENLDCLSAQRNGSTAIKADGLVRRLKVEIVHLPQPIAVSTGFVLLISFKDLRLCSISKIILTIIVLTNT